MSPEGTDSPVMLQLCNRLVVVCLFVCLDVFVFYKYLATLYLDIFCIIVAIKKVVITNNIG